MQKVEGEIRCVILLRSSSCLTSAEEKEQVDFTSAKVRTLGSTLCLGFAVRPHLYTCGRLASSATGRSEFGREHQGGLASLSTQTEVKIPV